VAKLAGRGITSFPPELLDPQLYLETGEKAWVITLPVKIDLSDNDIPAVPPTVSGDNPAFNGLKVLELRNNKITDICDGCAETETRYQCCLEAPLLAVA